MAKLRADKKNYKKAFNIHANSYDNWVSGSSCSRRLLLCYCIECGLKCLIMQENNIYRVNQANKELADVLNSHDLKALLGKVGQAGNYKFKQFPTEYGDFVPISKYHELCRYSISPRKDSYMSLQEFDSTLVQIKEWLREVV